MRTESKSTIYGLIAEFDDPEEIVIAAHKVHEEGYKRVDAYTPFPVHGLAEATGFKDIWVPWIIFLSGTAGAIGGFVLQWWVSAVANDFNVGGRPYVAWPSFIPVTFESCVLLASFGAVVGMLALNGLPRPHHPIFNARQFERASQDKFFLCIEAKDPKFDAEATRDFLETLGAESVSEVEN